MDESLVEVHAIVHGLVQGVAFRATTQYIARKLELKGSVKNLPDGTVEIIAQGPRLKVEQLLDALREPTGPGRIERYDKKLAPISNDLEPFQIII